MSWDNIFAFRRGVRIPGCALPLPFALPRRTPSDHNRDEARHVVDSLNKV